MQAILAQLGGEGALAKVGAALGGVGGAGGAVGKLAGMWGSGSGPDGTQ